MPSERYNVEGQSLERDIVVNIFFTCKTLSVHS